MSDLAENASIRVSVDSTSCVGSGMCEALAEEVFTVSADGYATAVSPGAIERLAEEAPDLLDRIREAEARCPTAAILIEDGPS